MSMGVDALFCSKFILSGMRHTVLILVLAVGCASSPPKPRRIAIELYELRAQGQRTAVLGPHNYVVRLRNTSDQPFTVQSVQLEPAGTSDLEVQGGLDTSQWLLEPGQTTDVSMATTITSTRGFNAARQGMPDASSLRVTVSCSSESGNFYESDTQYVSPLRSY
jgi:hypothetical protein